jgi:hypothetical protein
LVLVPNPVAGRCLAEGPSRKQAVPFLKKRDPKNFIRSIRSLPSWRRRPSPLRPPSIVVLSHYLMGFARARREIVAFPHAPTNKSFLLLFFKKEGACLPASNSRRQPASQQAPRRLA